MMVLPLTWDHSILSPSFEKKRREKEYRDEVGKRLEVVVAVEEAVQIHRISILHGLGGRLAHLFTFSISF